MAPLKWGSRGVRGEQGVCLSLGSVLEGRKAAHKGPYLPIKVVQQHYQNPSHGQPRTKTTSTKK